MLIQDMLRYWILTRLLLHGPFCVLLKNNWCVPEPHEKTLLVPEA